MWYIQCGSKASHIWRRITKYWPKVENGISWVIRNGHSIRFWLDNLVRGVNKLCDLAIAIPPYVVNFHDSDYVVENGWNWSIIN